MTMKHTKPPTHYLHSNRQTGTTTHNNGVTTLTPSHTHLTMTATPQASGNPGTTGKSYDTSHTSGWIDYSKPTTKEQHSHTTSTRPLTAYSSDYQSTHHHSRRPKPRSGSLQSRTSTQVPPGHVAIDLHSSSRQDWARVVKFAMDHPHRMRAANEIPESEFPQASTSMDQEQYEKACEELQKTDLRIPQEAPRKAVQLLFSVNLLPGYDLSTCYTIELHSTNMIALIMPLPDTSQFQMPPPYGKNRNFTWALVHGTTLTSAQRILLEGKIRPANWTFHKDDKCPRVIQRSHHGQNVTSLTLPRKRAKASKRSSSGPCTTVL